MLIPKHLSLTSCPPSQGASRTSISLSLSPSDLTWRLEAVE